MKIALIGYGKMGREIETVARERNHTIAMVIDVNNQNDLRPENLRKTDVAIEFTTPASAPENLRRCFEAGVPVVCGTTGWMDAWNTVADACRRTDGGLFYASNYSLGVNILFYLNRQLARIMNRFSQYDVHIEEVHHTAKIDKPSGTAITLANDIIKEFAAKKRWELDGASTPESIMIRAVRKENVPGIHSITWDSENDILQLYHSAKSRRGFALGAVLAAEFMQGKKGIYGMNDLLQF